MSGGNFVEIWGVIAVEAEWFGPCAWLPRAGGDRFQVQLVIQIGLG